MCRRHHDHQRQAQEGGVVVVVVVNGDKGPVGMQSKHPKASMSAQTRQTRTLVGGLMRAIRRPLAAKSAAWLAVCLAGLLFGLASLGFCSRNYSRRQWRNAEGTGLEAETSTASNGGNITPLSKQLL